jgi:hypothetical protein
LLDQVKQLGDARASLTKWAEVAMLGENNQNDYDAFKNLDKEAIWDFVWIVPNSET